MKKALFRRLRSRRGMTLVELIAACLIMSIVMLGLISFLSFTSSSTVTAHQNSTAQNEFKLMMMQFKQELVAATSATISNGLAPTSDITEVVFCLDSDGRFTVTTGSSEGGVRVLNRYEHIPDMSVDFEKVSEFIIEIRISNNNSDMRHYYELVDRVLLPNLQTAGSEILIGSNITTGRSGNSLVIKP